ncbi:MAG: NAD(P)-dependent oxidoreductase [Thermoplasmata archaeon]|nr:NAD(P)-dependent oxidoreductase [Thermoplasmata archaeon]
MKKGQSRLSGEDLLIDFGDRILVTGAAGFIGTRLVHILLERGFTNILCLIRETSDLSRLKEVINQNNGYGRVELLTGNLLSKEDCRAMANNVVLIYHLAAGTGTKAFSEAFLNSVVTTRNLLEATFEHKCLRRFVNVSSFAVYNNRHKCRWRLLDESSPVEYHPESRAEAYCYGKVKQDELVMEYGGKRHLPYVIMRPGTVYGPGKKFIPGRVGIDTFGAFLHMGGPNRIPLTYSDNCAEAIMLAGLKKGIEGEVFNIVDNDLPTSRQFLRLYKKMVRRFKSLYMPHSVSWLFCLFWEKLSAWSKGQIPAAFTRREWSAYWKKTYYSNEKLKNMLGWSQGVPTEEGLKLFFDASRDR